MKSATAILPHPKEGHEDCTAKHKGADSGPYAMQLKNAFIGGIREEICAFAYLPTCTHFVYQLRNSWSKYAGTKCQLKLRKMNQSILSSLSMFQKVLLILMGHPNVRKSVISLYSPLQNSNDHCHWQRVLCF